VAARNVATTEGRTAMGDTTAPLTLNQKVVEFARAKLGQQVGAGECWDLAEDDVTQAGGESSKTLTGVKGKAFESADYKWGTEVKLDTAQPGDVLQFKGHESKETMQGGAWQSQTRGHHTAIVEKNLGDGRLIILEQHVRPAGSKEVSKKVQQREIFVKDGATYKEPDGSKITIKTKGVVKAYRPKPSK
jgi:hypothetical protein